VGVTPEGIERPKNHCKKVNKITQSERPITICPPGADPKWRYFWRIGDPPSETNYPELNSKQVIPDPSKFPEWEKNMNSWGNAMINALYTISEMLAVGLGLPVQCLRMKIKNGPHLLAPTGSDLKKHGKLGTVLAGYHYDLNLLTIHGKSNFPALELWLKTTENSWFLCQKDAF